MKKEHEPLLVKEYLPRLYDSMEFTLASGISDYDVKANVTGAYENVPVYTTVNIRVDQNVTIKFNSTGNRAVTISSNRPFELDNLIEITNIYITNTSGSTANIKIIATRKGA
jgi:hypothetical protein